MSDFGNEQTDMTSPVPGQVIIHLAAAESFTPDSPDSRPHSPRTAGPRAKKSEDNKYFAAAMELYQVCLLRYEI